MPRFAKSAETSAMASWPTLPVKTGGTGSFDGAAAAAALGFGSIVGVKELSLPEFWRTAGLAGTSIAESAAGLTIFEVRDVTFFAELEAFIEFEGIEETGESPLEKEKAALSRRDRAPGATCDKEITGENEETRNGN